MSYCCVNVQMVVVVCVCAQGQTLAVIVDNDEWCFKFRKSSKQTNLHLKTNFGLINTLHFGTIVPQFTPVHFPIGADQWLFEKVETIFGQYQHVSGFKLEMRFIAILFLLYLIEISQNLASYLRDSGCEVVWNFVAQFAYR